LSHEFPNDNFGGHKKAKAVSNAINNARLSKSEAIKDVGGTMGLLANRMEMLRTEDPGWRIHFHHDGDRLTRLFWQTPQQAALSQVFGAVVFMDSSYNRNEYGMPLATFLVIDEANASRNIAHCIHSDETAEAFEWMLVHLKTTIEDDAWTTITKDTSVETRPKFLFKINVIFTDRCAAMIVAIRRTLPDAFHAFCIFHIHLNMQEALLGRLGKKWDDFIEAFWYVYRCAVPETFDKTWERLLVRFPEARKYLTESLYPCREHWAWAWVGTQFTAGQRSTSRVESEHKNQKAVTKLGAKVSIYSCMAIRY
jgi:hypothetical protein